MSEPRFHVLDDPASAVAELLVDEAMLGGHIVLTGGSTPGAAYERAAELEPLWPDATLWWGDERCVPPDDGNSNYALAKRTLLDSLIASPTIHRIQGELDPEVAAERYEQELSGVKLGLLLLGLGPDGHIASLFPGSPQLAERERLVTHGPAGLEPFVERVTLTLPALLSAERIVVLVAGSGKADAVQRSFRDAVSDDVPGSLLRLSDAPLDIFLDGAAATGAAAN
jgi:6-phosphogluconolactonase